MDIRVLKVVETGDAADLTVTGKQEERHRERRRPHGPGRRRPEAPARGVEELDRKIRSMHVPAFLATRFLSGSRRGLPKTVSLLALFGVALGAASLVVAMGLMSGYRHDLAERIAGTSAEVIAMPEPGTAPEEVRRALANLPNVAAVARTGFAPALVLSAAAPQGADALVKALDLPAGLATTRLLGRVRGVEGAFAALRAKGETPVLLGSVSAKARRHGRARASPLETASRALSAGRRSPEPGRQLTVAARRGDGVLRGGRRAWAVLALADFDRLAPAGRTRGACGR